MDVRSALRGWILIAVVAVVGTACADSGTERVATAITPPGNPAQFCAQWPDVRAALLGVVTGTESFDVLDDEGVGLDHFMRAHDAIMEGADAIVPARVRADWDVAYDAYTSVSDLLFTTGYTNAVIRPVHVAMAFGAGGHEAARADAAEAVAAIDEWSVEACGDFCARWPEFEYIVRYEPNFDWGLWHDNLDRYLLSIEIGERLAPDAVKDDWAVAADIQRRRMTMFRDLGMSLDVDEATAMARWGVLPWDEAQAASDAALDRIQRWADANCEAAVLTVGAPGSVSLRLPVQPELSGLTVLSVLLPAGTRFADVESLDPYLAATCSNMGGVAPDMRPEDVPAEPLRPVEGQGEYFTSDVCGLIRHEERAIVPGGAHELFVGAYVGGPGAYGLYFAGAEYCTQIPVGVNGRTIVDVPPLEPCDLQPIGSTAEITRRTPPPAEATGRMWIELDSAMGRAGSDFCRLDAYVLRAGTTLNELGRGDAWPVGAVNFHRPSPKHTEGMERARAEASGRVPILAMPPSGTGEVMVAPWLHTNAAWDAMLQDPVPLDPGTYDLLIYEWCVQDEETGVEETWCASATVDVTGDTVVPLPELGACP